MGISLKPNGMASAAHALRYWERRQEVVSNNLANVSTAGFKAERAFASLVDGALPIVDAQTDLSRGDLRPTGNPLDLALGGDGFLVVQTPDGERLTRGGAFRLDDQQRIVDADGNPLLGEDGPLVAARRTEDGIEARTGEATADAADAATDPTAPADPGQLVQVDRAGVVRVEGREIGRLRLEQVPAGTRLEHAGGNRFLPPPDRAPVPDAERDVRQGAIEESNVSSVSALVEMITVQRAFASVQKAMTTLDDARGTLVSEIGRPV